MVCFCVCICVTCVCVCRYSPVSRNAVKIYVVQAINDQLGRHNIPTDSVSRNLLRLFTAAVGLPELRLLVAQRVDSWIQNPKVRTSSYSVSIMDDQVNMDNMSMSP